VRVLCLACREGYAASDEELREMGVRPPGREVTLYRAVGCPACASTGYQGRMGIFELMIIDDDIRVLLSSNADSKSIKRQAVSKGMGTLRADGARKVLRGVTSIAELLRATEEEGTIEQI